MTKKLAYILSLIIPYFAYAQNEELDNSIAISTQSGIKFSVKGVQNFKIDPISESENTKSTHFSYVNNENKTLTIIVDDRHSKFSPKFLSSLFIESFMDKCLGEFSGYEKRLSKNSVTYYLKCIKYEKFIFTSAVSILKILKENKDTFILIYSMQAEDLNPLTDKNISNLDNIESELNLGTVSE